LKKKSEKAAKAKHNGGSASGSSDRILREQLASLLRGGEAHVDLADALEGFPAEKSGVFATGLAHTAWQLLEHMRIAQWDILEFSRNAKHVSPHFRKDTGRKLLIRETRRNGKRAWLHLNAICSK
jgi:hypothetical protein